MVEPNDATPGRKQSGQKLSSIERLDAISETWQIMERGINSIRAIAVAMNVSNETASEYKKLAMHLAIKDAPNRENVRTLQYNRISWQAEKVSALITKAQEDYNDGKNVSLQSIAVLHNVLRGYMELIHRITGLNTEVNISLGTSRPPLVIYTGNPIEDQSTT